MTRLRVRAGDSPDDVYAAVVDWAATQGLSLYDHQDEAILELLAGSNVVLATPTGSGKSLVAVAAHAAALARDQVSYYSAPIKALVSEKFFDLCAVFGTEDVGMLTGDASVNADAPVICCTAEILANIALREGAAADVGLVVMDEFHFYAEPDRGWAWQVPLLELPQAQLLLMSATLGDVTELAADLTRRTGRETATVTDAERPVPLTFSWALTPLAETVEELVSTHQAPAYVVHFTQKDAVEHATSLLQARYLPKPAPELAERLVGVRFTAGFGKTLSKLLKRGIGVHHAGMLPRYRRLVEQLAQAGLLTVICGTDTLGVGINVPIRTVLFTGLAKFDGRRQRILRTREFLQIAGRAGRAGFDTAGYVVVQAPEHVIENERAKAKAAAKNAANPKKNSKPHLKKPPEGAVVWTEQTFEKLVAGVPEPLVSRMRVDNAMIVNVVAREEDAFPVLRRLLTENHSPRREQLRLARRALRLARSLVRSGILTRLDEVDGFGRRYVLTVDLPDDFALNQELAHFALAALDVLDPEAPTYPLDVVSVVEAVLEPPRPVLWAQQHEARGEAIAAMKADGVEYDERMELIEAVTWPQPLAELLEATYELYRASHPWLDPEALAPKSVVREMWEQGMGFTDLVARYQLARSEGLVLRYLSDAYRTLRQTVPERHRSPELDELVEWLGETVRQTDSSLLDEWEALADPAHARSDVAEHAPPPPPRPISAQERPFRVMLRNALWRRVELAARDDVDGLAALEAATAELADPPLAVTMTRAAWDAGLEAYYADHDEVRLDADARGPALLHVERTGRRWSARQTLHDPAGDHDWVIQATVDLDASDAAGEAVVLATALHRLDGWAG
jgi:superfamily II DNA/RNA helicase